MGGVDLLDYFVNVYRPHIRSKKWYWPLFQYSLLLSLHSAMKLYHERSGGEERSTREKSFLVFIRNVHKTLFGKYKKDRCRGAPHELGRGDPEVRYDRIDHLITQPAGFVTQACRPWRFVLLHSL